MDVHEVCDLFPMMDEEQFAKLRTDIARNGVREPIWTYEGKLIDGRNRLRACKQLGIEPPVREWDGKGSLVGFVLSLNLHRRHLTTEQKVAVGIEAEAILSAEAKERQRAAGGDRRSPAAKAGGSVPAKLPEAVRGFKGEAREQAAQLVGVSPRSISEGKRIRKARPDLIEKMKAGEITLAEAKREAEPARATPKPAAVKLTPAEDALLDAADRANLPEDPRAVAALLVNCMTGDEIVEMLAELGSIFRNQEPTVRAANAPADRSILHSEAPETLELVWPSDGKPCGIAYRFGDVDPSRERTALWRIKLDDCARVFDDGIVPGLWVCLDGGFRRVEEFTVGLHLQFFSEVRRPPEGD